MGRWSVPPHFFATRGEHPFLLLLLHLFTQKRVKKESLFEGKKIIFFLTKIIATIFSGKSIKEGLQIWKFFERKELLTKINKKKGSYTSLIHLLLMDRYTWEVKKKTNVDISVMSPAVILYAPQVNHVVSYSWSLHHRTDALHLFQLSNFVVKILNFIHFTVNQVKWLKNQVTKFSDFFIS